MLIGLVGVCASGKSTLGRLLKERGYRVRQIAQEHSYVPDMWRRITNPDVLIYLDVSYPNTLIRRKLSWKEHEYQTQLQRLAHARLHANLIIDTNDKTPDQVLTLILDHLQEHQG
jgi:deoxyadenosine/deoxycytidine kinase